MCDGNPEKRVITYEWCGAGRVVVYDSGKLFQVGFELALAKMYYSVLWN